MQNAAQNNPHKKVQHNRQAEMFSIDYMYMTAKPTKEEIAHPILVIKARISGGVWALPVTRKGPYMNNIVKRISKIISSVGCPKMVLNSDQEPAMIAIQKETRRELWNEILEILDKVKENKMSEEGQDCDPGGVVILENSPVGESQSNGSVERAIKEVQNQIRILKI